MAYCTLNLTEKVDYTAVKEAILWAYGLVPEAYRQDFRGLKLRDDREGETIRSVVKVSWCG